MTDVNLNLSRPPLDLAVVVGAGNMGVAVARALGRNHRLLIADISPDRLERVADSLKDGGHSVETVVCDVTDPRSVGELAAAAGRSGGFRVLAHVAGLSPSLGDWDRILNVNLIGPTLTEAAFRPLARAGAVAVYVGSLAGHLTSPSAAVLEVLDDPLATPDFPQRLAKALGETPNSKVCYMLTKYALMRLCRFQASAWGRQGARILSVSPGLIASSQGALEFKNEPAKFDLLDRTPLARQGSLLEIADAIDFLVSERASFITGTDLLVDGGIAAVLRGKN